MQPKRRAIAPPCMHCSCQDIFLFDANGRTNIFDSTAKKGCEAGGTLGLKIQYMVGKTEKQTHNGECELTVCEGYDEVGIDVGGWYLTAVGIEDSATYSEGGVYAICGGLAVLAGAKEGNKGKEQEVHEVAASSA
eukprot:11514462-Ditylum_brightwellii.AAC.1